MVRWWGNGSTALPRSHVTPVTDGLEQAGGMAGTPGLPRAALQERPKEEMFSMEEPKDLGRAAPRVCRGDVAGWLCTHTATGSSCSEVQVGLPRILRADFLSWKAWSLPLE